jgi:hypothetical protein
MTALKVVATDTASGATSNLLELWAGSTPALKLSVGKGGSIISKVGTIASVGTPNASGLSLELFFPGYGLGVDNNGNTQFLINGFAKTRCGLGVVVASDQAIAWSSTTHTGLGVASDTILLRDGAPNTLALRNGTNAQTFNVYGTYTSGTSYERLTLSAPSAANAIIGTNKGSGGGTARGLEFQTDGVTRMTIATTGLVSIPISIAVSSAVRTNFINNLGDSLSMFSFVNDSTGTSTYAVGGSAPLMRFGGTTNLFPAIKRSTTYLQARLADDSAFAPIQGKLTTDTAYTGTVVAATGYITIYDSTGTAYRVPCAL